jgi:hypothetical protein
MEWSETSIGHIISCGVVKDEEWAAGTSCWTQCWTEAWRDEL